MSLIPLFFIFIVLKNTDAQDCSLKNFNNVFTNNAVEDIASFVHEFPIIGTISVIRITREDTNPGVIEVSQENGILYVKSNASFNQIDELILEPQDSPFQYRVTFEIICEKSASPITFTFVQPIIDTNNHKPTFLKKTYSLNLPMPLLPKWDLTSLGSSQIIARDEDFSNKQITFTLEANENFNDVTLASVNLGNDKKAFALQLRVRHPITLNETTTVTIRATDSGTPKTKYSTATLTINVDADSSIPNTPTFSSSTYHFKYKDGDFTEKEEIKLNSNHPEITDVTWSKDENFDISFNPSTLIVTIKPSTPIKDITPYRTITLTASVKGNPATSSSLILIQLTKDVIIPKFLSSFYKGNYTLSTKGGTDTFTLDGDIEVSPEGVVVTIVDGDYSSNFEIKDANGGKYKLVVKKNLNLTTITDTEIIIILKATISTLSDGVYANVIVTLPSLILPTPKFTQSYFTGKYKNGVTPTVDMTNQITIKSDYLDKVKINVIGTYKNNFEFSFNSNKWQITVKKPLNDEILKSEKELLLEMKAILENAQDIDTATLVLIIQQWSEISFDKSYYEGSYSVEDGKGVIKLDSDINLNDNDVQCAVINVKDFSAKVSDGKCTLSVLNPLEDDVLILDQFVITLEASKSGVYDKNHTNVLIRLPKQPQFSQDMYVAAFDKTNDKIGPLSMDSPIKITEPLDSNKVQKIEISGENNEYFSVNDEGYVVLTTLLPDTILDQFNSLIFNLKVTSKETPKTGTAGLIITLIGDKNLNNTISFTNNYYKAKYDKEKKGETLKFQPSISIESKSKNIQATIEGDLSNYFTPSITSYTVTITLVTEIPEDIIAKNSVIVLTLKAVDKETEDEAKAVLVISLLGDHNENDHDDDHSSTGYIVAVAILTALLVATLIGVVVLYFLKFRKTSYNELDDTNNSTSHVTFTKGGSSGSENRKWDKPQRRPTTGLVKYENHYANEDVEDDKNDDNHENRRKSVAFDENVEKISIDYKDPDENQIEKTEL